MHKGIAEESCSIYIYIYIYVCMYVYVYGKVEPRTGHEGPEGE